MLPHSSAGLARGGLHLKAGLAAVESHDLPERNPRLAHLPSAARLMWTHIPDILLVLFLGDAYPGVSALVRDKEGAVAQCIA